MALFSVAGKHAPAHMYSLCHTGKRMTFASLSESHIYVVRAVALPASLFIVRIVKQGRDYYDASASFYSWPLIAIAHCECNYSDLQAL